MMLCSVVRRAPVIPLEMFTAPLVVTEYWAAALMSPTSNLFEPASVTAMEICPPAFTSTGVVSKSAIRPPQPLTGGLSGIEVCHWTC